MTGGGRGDRPADAGERAAPAFPELVCPQLFRWPLSSLWLRPWFDRVALRFIHRAYFPTSHAWAQAAESDGGAELCRRLPMLGPSPALEKAVAGVRAAKDRYEAAERQWRQGFFRDQGAGEARLADLQAARIGAAHAFMATRRHFGAWRRRLPPAGWEIATQEAVAARHAPRLSDPAGAYPAPPPIEPERSGALAARDGRLSWLAFDSPELGDRVTVRVLEPADAGPATPTLILLHGIAMEEEMWRPRFDPFEALSAAGWRVLKPEGPWHGRRRLPGRFGGEPVIARGVEGLLTCLQAWLAETAVLVAWARRQGGAVALSGISLGALTAQLYASRARDWPADLTPDALLLIATSGSLRRAVYDGALVRAMGLPDRLAEAGWDEPALERWIDLIEPRESAVPADRTLLLLGSTDRVTPYDGGQLLAARWKLPAENLFVRRQGHFSVSLGLAADRRPLERLCALVG